MLVFNIIIIFFLHYSATNFNVMLFVLSLSNVTLKYLSAVIQSTVRLVTVNLLPLTVYQSLGAENVEKSVPFVLYVTLVIASTASSPDPKLNVATFSAAASCAFVMVATPLDVVPKSTLGPTLAGVVE